MIVHNKRILVIALTSALLLLIPFVAMQFTNEVNWTFVDFVVAGTMLFGTGFLLDLIIRKTNKITYRIALIVMLLIVFLLIWTELAVGIFGTPFGGD